MSIVDVVACMPMNLLHSYVLLRNVGCVNCVMKLVDVIEPSHCHVCHLFERGLLS